MYQNYSVIVFGVNVSYKKIEETLSAPTLTNIAVANYTTAYARIKLLKGFRLYH